MFNLLAGLIDHLLRRSFMTSIFWPKRKQHVIKTMQLGIPNDLKPQLGATIRTLLCLVNALRNIEHAGEDGWYLERELRKSIVQHLSTASSLVDDPCSKNALGFIAEGLMGGETLKSMGSLLAGMDEQELVGYAGPLTTWLGKSRKVFCSAFFGTPNQLLQNVSESHRVSWRPQLLRE